MDAFVLQLHITGHCNLRCRHCYLDARPGELSVSQIEHLFSQYQELITGLESRFGKALRPFINITGGEPFMHSRILDILDLMDAWSDRFSFRLMSNGTLLTEPLLARLQRLNIPCLQVSLDGDEALHDTLRGSGNFQAVLAGLDKLYAYGIPAKVSFTAHAGNYRAFPKVAEICRAHHVSSLWSDRYVPCNDPAGLQTLTAEQTREYVSLLQSEKRDPRNRQAKLEIRNRRALQFLSSGEYPYYCTAGVSSMAVDDKGNVYPCRRLAVSCGNAFQSKLSEIYENAPLFVKLRGSAVPAQCASCRHAAFCRGGAKCLSHAVLGDINARDPGCWL